MPLLLLFQSTRPMRGATKLRAYYAVTFPISIHAPHAGRDAAARALMPALTAISIHAPHAGRDLHPCVDCIKDRFHFNPRAPCGARPPTAGWRSRGRTHFNPRAPCGARHFDFHFVHLFLFISIHAPHAGRDMTAYSSLSLSRAFQSTRPMRGATDSHMAFSSVVIFQSTRPMRGATFH